MYARYHHGGLGATQFAPLPNGASESVAMSACSKVGGTWLPEDPDTQNPNPAAGCNINIGASYPSYCSVPFATSLFDDCKLISNTAEGVAYGNYTAYQVAVNQGDPNAADALLQADADQTNDLLSQQDCSYFAAANNPALSQIFGPNNVCNFTNADGSMNLLFYGVLALIGLVTIKLITK
jgi:hypothetical protein